MSSTGSSSDAGVRRRFAVVVAALVWFSCAYFFQGGGWDQNAHFATTVVLVQRGTVALGPYQHSTGDLARSPIGIVANKAIGTSLAALPAYLVARVLTTGVANRGDQVILQAYVTTVLTAGLALTAFALLVFVLLCRRLPAEDAALLALAAALATPLFPNSTMLSSAPWVALLALAAYAVLEGTRRGQHGVSTARLFAAGLLAGLPMAFEYLTAVVVLPLGLYALALMQRRRRMLFFAAGVALAALVPLTYDTLVFGGPLRTGYAHLVRADQAAAAARGFFGFDGFSVRRLYELTFGTCRGYFFLSPFLVAALPGWLRLLRDRRQRLDGLVTAGVAWLILGLVASLSYWHSGSATGSRYALLFVTFAVVPVAAVWREHRGWVLAGIVVGAAFMLLATSVTAIPPPPAATPPYANVVGFWWPRFAAGNLASWRTPVLVQQGIGAGPRHLPFAFNLGQLLGLPGLASLLPYAVLMAVGGGLGRRWARAAENRPNGLGAAA